MPKVRANKLSMSYEQQGKGEPLVLIPYLAADRVGVLEAPRRLKNLLILTLEAAPA